jgi:SAM-dependent methyltransferase
MSWGDLGPSDAPGAICTGFVGTIEEMVPDSVLLDWAGSGYSVLDLGAGVGRNAVALAKNFEYVVAYDLPNMCAMMRARSDLPSNIHVMSDWEEASEVQYDVAVCSLVLQHLAVEEIQTYLRELRCDRLVVNSRTWIDFVNLDVLPLLAERFETVRLESVGDHFWFEGRPLQ